MSTSTVAASVEQKKAALQTAVAAHLAYEAALDALEELYVAPGANLGHLVAAMADTQLAAGAGPAAFEAGTQHVAAMDSIFESACAKG